VVSLVYVLINVCISQAASYLDRRWQAGRRVDRFATIM
jgi:hypothetical protein